MPPIPRPLVHGTPWAYVGRYCRCQLCRAAIARYRRERRRAGKGRAS